MKKKGYVKKILFVVDSLNIGGVQRLCVDECYELLDRKIPHLIVCLQKYKSNQIDIISIDYNFSKSKELNIIYVGNSRIVQVVNLAKILHNLRPNLVIAHSTRGAVLVRISSMMIISQVRIHLYIHQLLTLSNQKQKMKRILHSLFANSIYVSSLQFKLDWDNYVDRVLIFKFLFKKKIHFNRMGVYLTRLRDTPKIELLDCRNNYGHLIFMSRITSWKGFNTFKELSDSGENLNYHSLVISVANSRKEIFEPQEYISETRHFMTNTGIANIGVGDNAVHIYPSHYGENTKYPQSVGMNVLECLALGIPSIISEEGFESWPEFKNFDLISTCTWKSSKEFENILTKFENISEAQRKISISSIKNSISIVKHVDNLIGNLPE